MSVGEIVGTTGLSQPNVSNHLSCLLECGLVTRRPSGKFAFYELADERIGLLLETAEGIVADAARGLFECSDFQLPQRTRRDA